MPGLYSQCGGYRKLRTFNFATIIQPGTRPFEQRRRRE